MGQRRSCHETAPRAPAVNGFAQPAPPVSRSLMLLRGDFRAQGLKAIDFLRSVHPPAKTAAPSRPLDEGRLELRTGSSHSHTAVVAVVRELARRAARTWYASLEQPPSVEDPA